MSRLATVAAIIVPFIAKPPDRWYHCVRWYSPRCMPLGQMLKWPVNQENLPWRGSPVKKTHAR